MHSCIAAKESMHSSSTPPRNTHATAAIKLLYIQALVPRLGWLDNRSEVVGKLCTEIIRSILIVVLYPDCSVVRLGQCFECGLQ